jgi:hypothetical protein
MTPLVRQQGSAAPDKEKRTLELNQSRRAKDNPPSLPDRPAPPVAATRGTHIVLEA